MLLAKRPGPAHPPIGPRVPLRPAGTQMGLASVPPRDGADEQLAPGLRSWRESEVQRLGAPRVGAVLAKQYGGKRRSVGHTINERTASGRIPSRRRSFAIPPITPARAAMTDHCTCGSSVSSDDKACPHCGKPLAPKQAAAEQQAAADEQAATEAQATAQEQRDRDPFRRSPSLDGALLYPTVISACVAVIVQDFVGGATVLDSLVSLCVTLWAGFSSVLLFHLRFPGVLSPLLAYRMGLHTGIIMLVLAFVLGKFGSLTKWPIGYIVEAAPSIQALPVVAQLTSGMTPRVSSFVVIEAVSVLCGFFHTAVAVLGSVIAFALFPQRPRD